jgi:flagellin
MIIQHNLAAMNADRQFNLTGTRQKKSAERLSSGYRINRAADDAAGLAISEKMRRQIRGLTQASVNCQDGVSLVQIADGALNEVHDILHRGSELCIQAANDTMTQDDRAYIQKEIVQLLDEIDKIGATTTFNEMLVFGAGRAGNYRIDEESGTFIIGKDLPNFVTSPALDAGYMNEVHESGGKKYPAGTVDFTGVTADNAQELVGTAFNIDCSTCFHKYTFMFVDGSDTETKQSGENYIYSIGVYGITNGSQLVDRIISASGATPADHFTTLENKSGKLFMHENRDWPGERNLEKYQRDSRVTPGAAYDLSEMSDFEPYDIKIQTGSESGQDQTIEIRLPRIGLSLLGIGGVDVTAKGERTYSSSTWSEATGETTSLGSTTVEYNGASDGIESFKHALEYVSRERSRMGAYQNRLEHTINSLNNVIENTTAAESRIRDTDIAAEMVRFSAANILSQAGQSMLAQANQTNQGVLSLLG